MGIKINAVELLKILEITPSQHNIMLVGRHGIGKSEIIEHYFKSHSSQVVSLFLGQMSDPGDLIGLPVLDADLGKTEFRPPWWFPTDGKPIVLFLDELNHARPEILQTVMDLTLNKTLAGKKLPAGSRIISAVNEGEEYQLTELDPALISRFNIYYFSPSPAEWLLWVAENKVDGRVIGFIEENPDCLDSNTNIDAGLEKSPDRRSWRRVSEIISGIKEINKIIEKAIAGIVGISAALKFSQFVKNNSRINAKTILSGFTASKKYLNTLDIHELTSLNEGMFRTIETEGDQKTIKKYIENLELYTKWMYENKRNEALAHWTTLYDSVTYPKTKIAILSGSPFIYQHIVDFIKNIKL
ncbi:ATPase, AAA family [Treponema primitia ZAS-2]|uniref:ATPase, AAA family n=1 Tax=Treponema primitia (strain ATCC BAA-887 / DSM 12427 / ZAS-2) TaxID=545694 RepID=F5YI58_TREPZ|nr:AAA family ATPase [Treponema primitia]AEF83686.1 ATPase, AAA family [Treponema primitia ZAS-2]